MLVLAWFALFSILLFFQLYFCHFTEQIDDDDDDDHTANALNMHVNTIMCTNAMLCLKINVHVHLMLRNFIHLLYNTINNFTS